MKRAIGKKAAAAAASTAAPAAGAAVSGDTCGDYAARFPYSPEAV
jgi:hypothetical protein